MIRRTVLAVAAATAISTAAMGATAATTSNTPKPSIDRPGAGGPGLDWRPWGWRHCRRYLRMYRITGRRYWLWRYRRCIRYRHWY